MTTILYKNHFISIRSITFTISFNRVSLKFFKTSSSEYEFEHYTDQFCGGEGLHVKYTGSILRPLYFISTINKGKERGMIHEERKTKKNRLNNPIELFLNADSTILTIGTIKLYIFRLNYLI